jgi:uncharacterized protein (TIGR02271 family)
MALLRFKDYYPNHRDMSGDNEMVDFSDFQVYTESDGQVGSVKDALVEEQSGRFRYLVVDTGFWIFGKQVLLPIGLARFDYDSKRVYIDGLTKEQVENLPNFTDDMVIDSEYENQVRENYRPLAAQRSAGQSTAMDATTATTGTSMTTDRSFDRQDQNFAASVPPVTAGTTPPVDTNMTTNVGRTMDVDRTMGVDQTMGVDRTMDVDRYDYDRDSSLYGLNDRDHQRIRLYEEQLLTNKNRYKAGEVAVNKRIETETAHVSVPVEKERVVIERNAPSSAMSATDEMHDFREGEVARMEVYEESADIQKRPVVREEVSIHKEVDHETVEANEQVRREELDVVRDGTPIVEDSTIDPTRRGNQI